MPDLPIGMAKRAVQKVCRIAMRLHRRAAVSSSIGDPAAAGLRMELERLLALAR